MSKKITKKQEKEFNDKFIKRAIEFSAKSVKSRTDSFVSFELNTIVGKLQINLPVQQTYCFTVFSRFEDVQAAKKLFDCNPYSGKYNAHITNSNVDEAVNEASLHFECTLP